MSGIPSSICRVNKTKDYTIMSNYHLRSKNLSLKAIGLLSKVFSLPDEWDYSISGLVAICKESETAVKNALKELKEWGYLTVTKTREPKNGYFVYIYDFYEHSEKDSPDNKPTSPKPKKSNGRISFSNSCSNDADTSSEPECENDTVGNSACENPYTENHTVDIPVVDKHRQLNTNESITNKSNTKELNKENKKKALPAGSAVFSEKNSDKDAEKKKFADSVKLTEKEYDTLAAERGKDFTDKCIETLNNYKLASGKKYKSDYYAIRSWVIDAVNRQNNYTSLKNKSESNVKYYADDENPFADVI